jgi:hypothetical protein
LFSLDFEPSSPSGGLAALVSLLEPQLLQPESQPQPLLLLWQPQLLLLSQPQDCCSQPQDCCSQPQELWPPQLPHEPW